MADFDKAFAIVLKREGGYTFTDDKDDPGGQTYAGISRRANPQWSGWHLVDRDRSAFVYGIAPETEVELRSHVRSLYQRKYWHPIGGNDLPSQHVANILFSTAVLSGVKTARAMAKIMDGSELGEHLRRPAGLTLMRIARYSRLVDRNPKLGKYFRGWVNRALADFTEFLE